ncbi:MAG: hypothetical protein ABIH83_00210 [Candidatus Micrarchaeota archaeon]
MKRKIKISGRMVWPYLLVIILGLLWLAQEARWIDANIPLGPVALLAVALVLISNEYRK